MVECLLLPLQGDPGVDGTHGEDGVTGLQGLPGDNVSPNIRGKGGGGGGGGGGWLVI